MRPRHSSLDVRATTKASADWATVVATLAVIILGFSSSASAQISPEVTILDPNLRAAIELELGKTSDEVITRADMGTLATLTAEDSGIRDTTGLEYATNLNSLNLGFNQLSEIDVTPFVNLTTLKLGDNQLSEIDVHPPHRPDHPLASPQPNLRNGRHPPR